MGNESLLYFLKFPLLGLVYLFVLSALWVIVRSLPEPTAKGKKGERSGESQEEEALNPSTTLSGVQPASLNSTLGFGEGQRQLTQEELTLRSLPTAVGLESVNGPYLEVVASSNLTAKIIPLTQEIVLGRSKDCHVRLQDAFVSSAHATIYPANGGYALEDLGSRNGTFYREVPLQEPVLLQEGDIFSIGDNVFRYRQG